MTKPYPQQRRISLYKRVSKGYLRHGALSTGGLPLPRLHILLANGIYDYDVIHPWIFITVMISGLCEIGISE